MSPEWARSPSPSAVDLLAAALALADADVDDLALHFSFGHPDAGGVAARGAHDHDVRDRHGRGLVEDAAGHDLRAAHARRVADRTRLRVPLRDVQVLDDDPALGRTCLDDPAPLSAVLSGEHLHRVALLHLHLLSHL